MNRRWEVVTTRGGARAMRDAVVGEVMHPGLGPADEAQTLYVRQSRLAERLRGDTSGGGGSSHARLVLFDVGLGAASNALAALRVSESLAAEPSARPLDLVSFERDTGALALALEQEHAAAFGLLGHEGAAARALLTMGAHETARTRWVLRRGELLPSLAEETLRADLVFWDPFSPRANPALWTVRAFTALRARCGPRATLFTYSASTSVRAALLLAGFAVGVGVATGDKKETTAAAVEVVDLERPLSSRFLQRLTRSTAPLPSDAPADALARLAALPQLRG